MIKMMLLSSMLLSSLWAVTVGAVPKSVTIDGKNGGLVTGGAWDSATLKDKVHVIFYVDPDEKDTNDAFANALKAANLDQTKYATVAIVNMAATWKPNVIIEALLESKQEKFPEATYVKDKKKVLVKEWGLKDDSSDILVLNQSGKVLYSYEGKLDAAEIDKVLALLKGQY